MRASLRCNRAHIAPHSSAKPRVSKSAHFTHKPVAQVTVTPPASSAGFASKTPPPPRDAGTRVVLTRRREISAGLAVRKPASTGHNVRPRTARAAPHACSTGAHAARLCDNDDCSAYRARRNCARLCCNNSASPSCIAAKPMHVSQSQAASPLLRRRAQIAFIAQNEGVQLSA